MPRSKIKINSKGVHSLGHEDLLSRIADSYEYWNREESGSIGQFSAESSERFGSTRYPYGPFLAHRWLIIFKNSMVIRWLCTATPADDDSVSYVRLWAAES